MGCLKGLTVSSDVNRSTQYKILKDTLPVCCAEKLYSGVGQIVCKLEDWNENTFYSGPPTDAVKNTFSTLLCMRREVDATGNTTDVAVMSDKWVVFDKNLQKIKIGK